jgi:hypothetical protein
MESFGLCFLLRQSLMVSLSNHEPIPDILTAHGV